MLRNSDHSGLLSEQWRRLSRIRISGNEGYIYSGEDSDTVREAGGDQYGVRGEVRLYCIITNVVTEQIPRESRLVGDIH